jgi:glyoxylase-like metal-dependent hydrolase (beta-lactamase superfamily II)
VHDGHVHFDTTDLGHEVFMMDTRMGGYEAITSSYLIRGSRPCLVETGTARSAPVVIEQLQRLGVGPEDLATIVVTHIHLDHAGGVGDLAQVFPNAQIVVQERGARHLADPARLVASAHRVFGEAMDRLFGDLLPTAPERITAIGERGTVDLGDGRCLDAFHNPGHASHHIGLVDSATGDLYTGDAAGVYVPQTADVRPATPPPDFNLDLTLSSLAAMRAVRPSRLLFSHFGPVTAVDQTLDASVEELYAWVDTVRLARRVSPDVDHAVAMVKEQDRRRHVHLYEDPELLAAQEELSGTQANVLGIMRWLDLQSKG